MSSAELYDRLFAGYDEHTHVLEFGLSELFDIVDGDIETALKGIDKGVYDGVTPSVPKPPELDDLARLHYLVISRRVTTILEFGLGNSTLALASAISHNKSEYADFVAGQLRRSNPFELHSIDNMKEWLDVCLGKIPEAFRDGVELHLCPVTVGEFNGRLCTYYNGLPNICPDFIYLDGPHLYSAEGDLRGLHTRHADRLPMAADILAMEHFLLPGTLIVSDGRTANARFLQCNLQRNWQYLYVEEFDQHFFELQEQPLGKINRKQIDYCLGDRFYEGLET